MTWTQRWRSLERNLRIPASDDKRLTNDKCYLRLAVALIVVLAYTSGFLAAELQLVQTQTQRCDKYQIQSE